MYYSYIFVNLIATVPRPILCRIDSCFKFGFLDNNKANHSSPRLSARGDCFPRGLCQSLRMKCSTSMGFGSYTVSTEANEMGGAALTRCQRTS